MEKQATNHEGVCVAIRARPLNEREKGERQSKAFICDAEVANTITQLKDGQPVDVFAFDKVFDETSTNEGVYNYVAKNVVSGIVRGYNGTIFACKQIYRSH